MDSENIWKRLVTAATETTHGGSKRTRRALLSDAMTVGTTITGASVGCSITQTMGAGFRTPVASNALALDLDSAQYADDNGPCVAACRDGRVHSITVMADERAYPEFTRLALSHDVRSSLSLPLPAVEQPSALNLYARSPSAFESPHARAVATLLARCTAAILTGDPFAATGRPDASTTFAEVIGLDPQRAGDARIITAALRLLRDRDGLDDAQAFAELIRRSHAEGHTAVDSARALIGDEVDLEGTQ